MRYPVGRPVYQSPSALRVAMTIGLGCVATLATGLALSWAQAPAPDVKPASATPAKPAPAVETLVREGTELVDQFGQFKQSGNRIVFVLAEGNRQLIGLENLNLERVLKVISDNPQSGDWLVTGTVTEYRAINYLLIRRAILKGRTK